MVADWIAAAAVASSAYAELMGLPAAKMLLRVWDTTVAAVMVEVEEE
jgi:hypothetical protein